MKNILIVSILFLISLLSVTSLAVAETTVTNDHSANLVIYRPNDNSSLNYRIWVDGKYVGKLKVDEAMKLQVDPGKHVISSNDHNRTRLSVSVAEQGVTYVRKEVHRKTTMSLAVDKTAYQAFAGL